MARSDNSLSLRGSSDPSQRTSAWTWPLHAAFKRIDSRLHLFSLLFFQIFLHFVAAPDARFDDFRVNTFQVLLESFFVVKVQNLMHDWFTVDVQHLVSVFVLLILKLSLLEHVLLLLVNLLLNLFPDPLLSDKEINFLIPILLRFLARVFVADWWSAFGILLQLGWKKRRWVLFAKVRIEQYLRVRVAVDPVRCVGYYLTFAYGIALRLFEQAFFCLLYLNCSFGFRPIFQLFRNWGFKLLSQCKPLFRHFAQQLLPDCIFRQQLGVFL